MKKNILFIQGGGYGGYEADKELVASLQKLVGNEYHINYSEIVSDESVSDYRWSEQIGTKISNIKSEVILVGHSFGASMILKYLSENYVNKSIKGIFLVATPFWDGNEEWQAGFKLQEDFAFKLPVKVPIYFYHCLDDEEVPFSHLDHYKQKLTKATFREVKSGGHQFNNDLTIVANDIIFLNVPIN